MNAYKANDTAQMTAVLQQMVSTWRTVDLDDLKDAMPLVPRDQFAPTVAELSAKGYSATPDDVVVNGILRDAAIDIQAWTDALRADRTPLATLESLADQFSTRATRLDGLSVSMFGGIYNQREYTRLISHRIPAFYEAFFDELGAAVGLPRRAPAFPGFKRAGADSQKGTLAELLVTQATKFAIDKGLEEANKTFANAKKFVVDAYKQAAWTALAVSAAAELKAFVHGGDVYAVVSGASFSFRVFNEPTPNVAFIEVPGDFEDPALSAVMIIGPDTVAELGASVNDLFAKLKQGFSFGLDPKNNPKKFKNLNEAKKYWDEIKAKLKAARGAADTVQKIIENSYQTATSVERGCIFTSDATCNQLYYENGINPVYRYTPPPGFGGLGGLPVALVVIVQNQMDGLMYFDTPIFLPAPKK